MGQRVSGYTRYLFEKKNSNGKDLFHYYYLNKDYLISFIRLVRMKEHLKELFLKIELFWMGVQTFALQIWSFVFPFGIRFVFL